MPDARLDVLLRILDQAFEQRSWHGTNLLGSLRGLTQEELAWRPAPERHNAWEIAVHAAYWKYRVYRLLTDDPPRAFELKGSDWFARPAPEARWESDLNLLKTWHARLRQAMGAFEVERLEAHPGRSWYTYFDLMAGAAAHDTYHAGQIQLLKRLMRA